MGHPAFLFAVYFALRRQNWMSWAALVLATIGQADVLNTMCHIHTPLFYSIWRSITGVILGAFLGWIALWFYDRFIARGAEQAVASLDGNNPAPQISMTEKEAVAV